MAKTCSRCGLLKESSEFNNRARSADGLDHWCKECNSESCREYNQSEIGQQKARERALRKYKLSVEEYNSILKNQKFVCKICKNPETKQRKDGAPWPLAVDHCHETGKVRGLLCNNCNRGLGLLGDTRQHLAAALDYLDGKS